LPASRFFFIIASSTKSNVGCMTGCERDERTWHRQSQCRRTTDENCCCCCM
jgi:hypothetical protein